MYYQLHLHTSQCERKGNLQEQWLGLKWFEADLELKIQPWLSSSVKRWLVWSPVGFPPHHQHESKPFTQTIIEAVTVGCTVWYVNHTHYGLLLEGACGAAYSCVAPSGNPIHSKRAGGGRGVGGSYNCFTISYLYEVRRFILLAGWLTCVLTPNPGFLPGQCHLLVFGPILWIAALLVKKLPTGRAPVLTPSPHPVHPSRQWGRLLP